MSECKLSGVLQRRPSFWKTPITRDTASISGIKRNYSQITTSDNNNDNDNKNKKRRLLTESEIVDIAKFGGLQASNIILAVQESDGFCWFKRKSSNNTNFDKEKYLEKYWNIHHKTNDNNNGVLRELTKEELTKRSTQKQKEANNTDNTNKNDLNKEIAIRRMAKQRRHTLPINVLTKIVNDDEKKKKRNKKKRKKKEKKKKKKKVIEYVTEQQIIRKKVKKMKRIVYKKKTRCTTVKITTEFASVSVPDFPIPDIALSILFLCEVGVPLIAIKEFELRLIESFVLPLTNVYGQNSFITRNVLQLLMELKKNIDVMVRCVDNEVVCVPIKDSIDCYKDKMIKNSISPITETHNNEEDNEEDLDEEYEFHQHDLKLIESLCADIEEEIEFTNYVKNELQNEEYLCNIFDFDVDGVYLNNNNGLCDETFIEGIAADIDVVYSEYCNDLFNIEYNQIKYEKELAERELRYITEIEEEDDINVDDAKDKMIFSNFFQTNRELNGYEMNQDDTMNID